MTKAGMIKAVVLIGDLRTPVVGYRFGKQGFAYEFNGEQFLAVQEGVDWREGTPSTLFAPQDGFEGATEQ